MQATGSLTAVLQLTDSHMVCIILFVISIETKLIRLVIMEIDTIQHSDHLEFVITGAYDLS